MSDLRIVRRPVPKAASQGDWPQAWPALLRALHAARGSLGVEDAMPRLAALPPPAGLLDLDAGVALLREAIAREWRIVVTADFDCDGATACAVAVRGLRMLGARHVGYAVPDRVVHGYGLTPALVELIGPMAPQLLLTVDHGIACHAGIACARARGWRVIVTDHHLPGDTLPDANAVIDPNRRDDPFPAKSLAGVGVLFYLLLATRAALRGAGEPGGSADLSSLLDLVAVGTVADMVPLDRSNRALVGAGLRRIRKGKACAGIDALVGVSGRQAATLTTADIGFGIAPRINAAGRLEDMRVGIECLLTDDPLRAAELAAVLHEINKSRRDLQDNMVDDAIAAVDLRGGELPLVPCLHHADWHPGVIGLVASRLKEHLHRPVLALAPSGVGDGRLRGSARSIPGFHMRDAIALVDARHPRLIERFGGHAMAAGLTIAEGHLPGLVAALQQVARERGVAALLQPSIDSDGSLSATALDIMHANALRDGGAWGQGYPEPVFDDEFEVLEWRQVGASHLRLQVRRGGRRLTAMHFGGWCGEPPASRERLVYRLVPDEWRGGQAVQLVVLHRQAA